MLDLFCPTNPYTPYGDIQSTWVIVWKNLVYKPCRMDFYYAAKRSKYWKDAFLDMLAEGHETWAPIDLRILTNRLEQIAYMRKSIGL